jgi:hypothetical protein
LSLYFSDKYHPTPKKAKINSSKVINIYRKNRIRQI